MASNPLIELRNFRLEKIEKLRALGINPFPSKSHRTHYAQPIKDDFESLIEQQAVVAGRLMSWRKQGGLSFGTLQDQTGKIQLFVQKKTVEETNAEKGCIGYSDLSLLDVGDLVEAEGAIFRTQRGEISIRVERIRVLSKSMRPLPDQWFGLKDREQILRKRYLDIILNPETQDRYAKITLMVAAIRQFLNERGFLEFNTPVIQPQYGGGTAKPFKTHVNDLGCDMYLAISHELYLKRLVTAGYDKVYTIGRYFRNEGIDKSHHPEFSMVETMTAYENYEYNMELVESMFRHVAKSVFGRTVFKVGQHEIDFEPQWKRAFMADLVQEITGVDFRQITDPAEANQKLKEMEIHEPAPSVGEAMVLAFEEKVEPTLIQPTLVYGHPVEISPLAKQMDSDPRYVERFEIFIAGMECGDNWSEQNDPKRLLETWQKNYKPEEKESGNFHALDFDFIEALEYGMPPTTGIGPGLERMSMIFTEQENIDDVIFFPMMRPSISKINADLYGVKTSTTSFGEELVVTFEEFASLSQSGGLAPETSTLTLRPHLHIWDLTGKDGSGNGDGTKKWKASGHVVLDGFFLNGTLRLAGYSEMYTSKPDFAEARKAFVKSATQIIEPIMKHAYPNARLKVESVLEGNNV